MPEKLMRCVQEVMAKGKSKEEAFAICTVSTGEKVERRSNKVRKGMSKRSTRSH